MKKLDFIRALCLTYFTLAKSSGEVHYYVKAIKLRRQYRHLLKVERLKEYYKPKFKLKLVS